jgi:hypothetical protein
VETSLHRRLKEIYAGKAAQVEVPLDGYRIDAVCGDQLVEIQHGSLAAIRDKVRRLLKRHRVLVVKPIVSRKLLIQQDAKGGNVVRRRRSPKRGELLDLFDELVYFTGVFPHASLTLEVVLVEIEEWRYPATRRSRRGRPLRHMVEDQHLIATGERLRLQSAADLRRLLPARLPRPFHTQHLADRLKIDRWVAQRIAYCLRKTGAVKAVGKQGNALLYELPSRRAA